MKLAYDDIRILAKGKLSEELMDLERNEDGYDTTIQDSIFETMVSGYHEGKELLDEIAHKDDRI